jgi:hypothetical protein
MGLAPPGEANIQHHPEISEPHNDPFGDNANPPYPLQIGRMSLKRAESSVGLRGTNIMKKLKWPI